MSKSLGGHGSETSPPRLTPQKVLAESACLAACLCIGVALASWLQGAVSKWPFCRRALVVENLGGAARDQGGALPQ